MQRKTCDIGTDQSDDSKNGVTSPYVMKRSIIQNSSVLCRNTATLQRLQRLLPKLLPRPFTFTKRAVDSDSFSFARREQTSHRCYEGKRRESEREKKIKYAENQRSPVPTDASGASTSSVPARTDDRGKIGRVYIHLPDSELPFPFASLIGREVTKYARSGPKRNRQNRNAANGDKRTSSPRN